MRRKTYERLYILLVSSKFSNKLAYLQYLNSKEVEMVCTLKYIHPVQLTLQVFQLFHLWVIQYSFTCSLYLYLLLENGLTGFKRSLVHFFPVGLKLLCTCEHGQRSSCLCTFSSMSRQKRLHDSQLSQVSLQYWDHIYITKRRKQKILKTVSLVLS